MVESVVALSTSSVYRVSREANRVCGWKPRLKVKGSGRGEPPRRPDERWQTDIQYVRVGARNDYRLSFMDVYSRYIVHHERLTCMDGQSVSAEAAAIATLDADVRPDIQSNPGSGVCRDVGRIWCGSHEDSATHADRRSGDGAVSSDPR